jgi:hypothetical protein
MAFARLQPPRWMNGTFYCQCTPPDSAKYLCSHLIKFYRECADAGKGPFRTRFKLDGTPEVTLQTRTPKVPIVGGVLYDFRAEVVPHWTTPDESLIRVWDELDLCEEMYMLPDDSLIKLIGQVCDTLRAKAEYTLSLEKLYNRKAVPCPSPTHGHRQNLGLSRRIHSLAQYRIGDDLWSEAIGNWDLNKLEIVLEEIALAETYDIVLFNKCSECRVEAIDPLNVPADLVPSV